MKRKRLVHYIILGVLLVACADDNSRSCTSCTSSQTLPFEVCQESNGNASVNGEDTGVSFDIYISDLEAAGATCGG